jgi:hypothetical protein
MGANIDYFKEKIDRLEQENAALRRALQFVIDEHELSNRELVCMGGKPNKPSKRVLLAMEALSGNPSA